MTLKKFTLAILLTFTLTIAYQVFAAYLTSPENLKYPNPGHYPGEIGPGTFNCSNNTNCYWRFPNALFINSTSGKVGIGTENPKEALEVNGSAKIQGNISANNYPPKACGPGYSIRQINSDGSVVCEKDDVGITSESDPLSLHKTGGTITGDLNVTGGIVVGNPAGGNKGPGTINVEGGVYVNGKPIGGMYTTCYIDCQANNDPQCDPGYERVICWGCGKGCGEGSRIYDRLNVRCWIESASEVMKDYEKCSRYDYATPQVTVRSGSVLCFDAYHSPLDRDSGCAICCK